MASSQRRAQEAVRRKGENKCPHHRNKDVVFKCHDCNKLVCTACSTSTHRKHNLDEIYDVIPDAKRKIQTYITSAEQEQIQRIQAEIEKGEEIRSKNKQYYKNLISEIEKQRDILRSELDASFNDLIKTCREMGQRREDALDKHETELKTMIEELKSQIKACKDALQSTNNVLVCDISTDVPTKYKDIPAAESNRQRITTSQIEKRWLKAVETLKNLGAELLENEEKCLPLDQNPANYLTVGDLSTFQHKQQQRTENTENTNLRRIIERSYKISAAIDLGTILSGYAFSFISDYQEDPLKVFCVPRIYSYRLYQRIPTCVLFDPSGNFVAFGIEAEEKYLELAVEQQHREWFYFRHFKMILNREKIMHRETTIRDETGKTMKAVKVFSAGIKYFVDQLINVLKNQMVLSHGDIRWVLTVPAIWSDSAKQFMREAAEQAGIASDQLLIALEPEAASLFYTHLSMIGRMDGGFSAFKAGSRHLVLNAGGRTINTTLLEVQSDRLVRAVHTVNGGDWGASKIDDAFGSFLSDIVGNSAYNKFCNEDKYDMLELFRDIEVKKMTISPDNNKNVVLRVPIPLIERCKSHTGKDISEQVRSNGKLRDNVVFRAGKLRIKPYIVRDWFKDVANHIVEHLKKVIRHPDVSNVKTILMVGEFSQSIFLQEIIKQNFQHPAVIFPEDPDLAVVKGAVIYGLEPSSWNLQDHK